MALHNKFAPTVRSSLSANADVTSLNLIKPLTGIAAPTAVGADVKLAHTPKNTPAPVTEPVMAESIAGTTFPVSPLSKANHLILVASIRTLPP